MIFDRRAWVSGPWSIVRPHDMETTGPEQLQPDVGPAPRDASLPALARRPRWVMAAVLIVTAVLGVYASRVSYDHNLLHLQAWDLDSVKWELTLIEHTAGASWHALSYTSTPEEALALKARYEQLPEVSRVVEVASLVPRDQDYKMDLMHDIRRRLDHLPPRGARIPHDRPNSSEIQTELARLLAELGRLSDRPAPGLLTELRGSLKAFQDQLAQMPPDAGTETRLQDLQERMAGSLAEDLYRLRDVSTPTPITVADLPPDLRVRYIGRSGKWLLQVFAKDCLWDFEPLEHFTRQILTVDSEATGKPFGTVEGLRSMKSGFQWAGVYALLVITAVLGIDFRGLRNILIALTPLAMGVLLSLGILGLFHFPLNPANMIAFPLILGVGVDNGVHILHDHLLRRRQGIFTISRAIGRGVLVKALTTMIGFGALMISSERGLAGLGFILLLGVACCMVSALVFLPAVLCILWTPAQVASATPEPARNYEVA